MRMIRFASPSLSFSFFRSRSACAVLCTGLALLLGACGSAPEKAPVSASTSAAASSAGQLNIVIPPNTPPTPAERATASTTGQPVGVVGVRSRLLGGRTITLPPTRPLVVNTRCNFANETGYKGDAVVEVQEGIVRQMRVFIDVPAPNAGRCVFDMSGMVQTKSVPSVELLNRSTGCTARMWEQGATAVVSFSNCASSCTSAESFKYVWPVLINRVKNHCD